MKSYNGLYERMLDRKAIMHAIHDAAQHKRKRKVVRDTLDCIEYEADKLANIMRSGTWYPPKHKPFDMKESATKKARKITKPQWKYEQIVHHMLVDQLEPIILSRLYKHVCGSVPGRGTHSAVKTMIKWVRKYKGKKFYVAELDIRKFYDNIDHDILKQLLRKRIRDTAYLDLMYRVIDAHTIDGEKRGLALGNYTSPWLANFYLIGVDDFVLQELKPDHFLRYMDNLWLYSTKKRKLHAMVKRIMEWVSTNRKLTIKDNWQVFRFDDGNGHGRAINALGFIIHRDRVGVRKNILKPQKKSFAICSQRGK